MITFGGHNIMRLTLTAGVDGKNGTTETVFRKLYIGNSGEVGRIEIHPHPDRLAEMVENQHRIFERAGYVVEEEDEQVSTNGVNHWLITRSYRLREATNT